MITQLKSDCLTVEITAPGTAPNNNYRFDRTSYISEVILYDGTRFCASEPRNLPHPSSSGQGFCSCNRWDDSENTDVGEYYPIIGIGLIKKQSEAKYRQFNRYDEGFIPFETRVSFTDSTMTAEVLPMECRGYAFYEKRIVTVAGDTVRTEVTLENRGTKGVKINEYCHNFISIGGMAVGPDYTITMPQLPDMTGAAQVDDETGGETNFIGFGSGYRMLRYQPEAAAVAVQDYSFYHGEPFVWRISNAAAGAFVEGTDEVNMHKVKFWTCDHMVCPEIYQWVELNPGEAKHWVRSLQFGTL